MTGLILKRATEAFGAAPPLWFVGGRQHDHNSMERLRGFRAACEEAGQPFAPQRVLMPGYSPQKAFAAMEGAEIPQQAAIFVNSTIALEGVVRWLNQHPSLKAVRFGCFDWDPFAALLPQNVGMTEQDVTGMLAELFRVIDAGGQSSTAAIKLPCILRPLP